MHVFLPLLLIAAFDTPAGDMRASSRRTAPAGTETTGACATQVTGDVVCYDNNGIVGGQRTSTTDPDGLLIRPQACSPSDGTCTAANIFLAGGQDTTLASIEAGDPTANCPGDNDTVTVTVYNNAGASTATVLTEGTNWTASASVADTCASLATAVDALAGVSASCTSPDVRISLDTTTGRVDLAESTAACTTVSTGTFGQILIPSGSTSPGSTPAVAFFGDTDTGIISQGAGRFCVVINGTCRFEVGASSIQAGFAYDVLVSLANSTGNLLITDDVNITGAGLSKGAITGVRMSQQSLTFAANPGDASKVTSGLVPDGAMLMGITTRVTTTATNCTSVSLGDGTDVDMFGATTGITAGTTTSNADATAQFARSPATAAMEVTVTANGAPCFNGVWRITAHYILPIADTSN